MSVPRTVADPSSLLAGPRRAAERVVERYSGGPVAVAGVRHTRTQVDDLLAALERVLVGAEPEEVAPGPLDRLELLRALRSETLRDWDPDERDLLPLMCAIEAVQDDLLESRRTAAMGEALTPFARDLLREVSHLLRSPLGSIVMLTEMLRDGHLAPLTEAQARQVSIIHRAALGITCTANDLLTLVDDRDRIMRLEPFSIAETLTTVGDVLGPVAESKGVTLVVRADATPGRVGPALALREILLSLGLRLTLDLSQGNLELSADDDDGDFVRFSVRTRSDLEPSRSTDRTDPLVVFRADEEGGFTIYPGGLAVAAVTDLLGQLHSELDGDGETPSSRQLSFRIELPRE